MLTRTFLHLPNVGLDGERRYWGDGLLCWDDLLMHRDLFDDGPPEPIERHVTLSREKLSCGDARWFEQALGDEHAWRLAAEFDDGRIAYMDIESDGTKGDEISTGETECGGTTVCAVWDGVTARIFVRGRDLDELPAYLNRYKVLCTFNGKCFDVPYLESRYGKGFFSGAHLDLRPITKQVLLTGGLKKIETQIGLIRPNPISRYTGYDAVKFWSLYKRGRKDALDPLARYNLYDAVFLQGVLRAAYNLHIAHNSLPFRRYDNLMDPHFTDAIELAVKAIMK